MTFSASSTQQAEGGPPCAHMGPACSCSCVSYSRNLLLHTGLQKMIQLGAAKTVQVSLTERRKDDWFAKRHRVQRQGLVYNHVSHPWASSMHFTTRQSSWVDYRQNDSDCRCQDLVAAQNRRRSLSPFHDQPQRRSDSRRRSAGKLDCFPDLGDRTG